MHVRQAILGKILNESFCADAECARQCRTTKRDTNVVVSRQGSDGT